MLITVSGLDGAGKSTLIGLLKSRLERRELEVRVSHMYRDVGLFAAAARLTRRRGAAADGGAASRGRGVSREGGAGVGKEERRSGGAADSRLATAGAALASFARALAWNRAVRTIVYPLDLLLFALYRLRAERGARRVLIMDRYFYDTLVDVSAGRESLAARLLRRLTPTPPVPVLLDISPEAAFARKGERTITNLELRRDAYRRVFPNGGRGLILEADRDVGENLRAVERAILERMGGR